MSRADPSDGDAAGSKGGFVLPTPEEAARDGLGVLTALEIRKHPLYVTGTKTMTMGYHRPTIVSRLLSSTAHHPPINLLSSHPTPSLFSHSTPFPAPSSGMLTSWTSSMPLNRAIW